MFWNVSSALDAYHHFGHSFAMEVFPRASEVRMHGRHVCFSFMRGNYPIFQLLSICDCNMHVDKECYQPPFSISAMEGF